MPGRGPAPTPKTTEHVGGAATVFVVQPGFSQRWRGAASSVRFGLALQTRSATRDGVGIQAVVPLATAATAGTSVEPTYAAG